MITLLFQSLVSTQLVIESQFKASKCAGPPDTIYGFYVPDVTAYDSLSNYTWPPFWTFHAPQATVGSCGNLAVPIPGSCCIQSLDYSSSTPYNSGIPRLYVDKSSVNDVVSASADGTQYCYAEASDFNDYSSLLGYRFVYLLPNGDNCIDSSFKCNNGVLRIYNGTGCQGSVQTVTLSTTAQSSTGVAGSINAQLVTITQGNLLVSWVVDIPWKFIIAHWDGIGVVCAIFFILGMLIGLVLFVKDLLQVIKTRDKSPSKVLAVAAKLFWFLYILFSFLYWAVLFPTTEVVAQFSEIVAVSLGIASLLSVYSSLYILFSLFPDLKLRIKIAGYVSMLLLHFGLYGSMYFNYYFNGGNDNVYYSSDWTGLSASLNKWYNYYLYWILWMFLFDTFVPITVGLRIISLKNSKNVVQAIPILLQHNSKIVYWVGGQVLGFIFYYIISFIKFNTYLCGNDLMYLNMSAFLTFCLILHGVFTDSIIEIIVTLTKQNYTTPKVEKLKKGNTVSHNEPNSPATTMELL
ncbi:hypothetical protein HDV01_002265 [Terramyces sp. JEL0728]|nr:hypothetical protein HDV01_002265 [Terramyces sp. JEL0728]